MLGLKLPTDPRWVDIVEENINEILTDHAYCEMKAASYAMSLIMKYPNNSEIVDQMTELSREEMKHFQMVHNLIKERGLKLGKEKKDFYVHDLMKFIKRGGSEEMVLVDRLLIAAMIEARSCERFLTLSENIKDKELSKFYYDLMASEARHYTLFLKLAKKYGTGVDVEARWKEFLAEEAKIIAGYGNEKTVHG
ncbi:MAG: tRNA-(ms[2]io[6]A)-hydroxylase [Flavobacteriales bacterium]|jgi:tRNA-(ms[2]io[6]A)-hydroxylase|tara:strand:+ start:4903 stop:5484 length:582 start_codon:yes stop_codon:yes gene_type:complete